MRGLPARLLGPTVRAVSWNIDFYLRALPVAIYYWECLCILG